MRGSDAHNPSAGMSEFDAAVDAAFDAAIQERMQDPLWDERMSRDVIERSARRFTPGRLARNRLALPAGMAASILLVAGAALIYVQRPTDSTRNTPPIAAGDPGGTLEMGTANPTDLNAFPYRDEGDVSMVLDDIYGE